MKYFQVLRVSFLIFLIILLTSSSPYGSGNIDADLIVRTVNVHYAAPEFPLRLHGIARRFYHDYPAQIGLTGLQELKTGSMRDCVQETSGNGSAGCFAAELSALFQKKAKAIGPEKNWLQSDRGLGIIVGDDWNIIEKNIWDIGYGRSLLYVLLEHKTEKYRLRFYDTHLSPNSGVRWYERILGSYMSGEEKGRYMRLHQVQKLIHFVQSNAVPGELPPIVVGDFNAFQTGDKEESVRKMEEYFWRPFDQVQTYTGVDMVYLGRKEHFQGSRGYLQPLKWHHVPMRGQPVMIDGRYIEELTDHQSEGFTFKVFY